MTEAKVENIQYEERVKSTNIYKYDQIVLLEGGGVTILTGVSLWSLQGTGRRGNFDPGGRQTSMTLVGPKAQ